MIRKLIEPESWNTSTTYIGIFNESIVVRQRPDVLGQIQRLIDNLTPRPTGFAGMIGSLSMGGGMNATKSASNSGKTVAPLPVQNAVAKVTHELLE